MEAAQQLYRVPDRGSVDHYGGRGHEDSDQRIEGHGGRESKGLADHLVALAAGEAGEVWNVERDRCQETYRGIQGGNQKFQEVGKVGEARWSGEHGAEATGAAIGPCQEKESYGQQNRGADAL